MQVLFVHLWQSKSCQGGKSVVPIEITFMDMEDNHYKYGTLRSLRYIYSNPFRFPNSSLGSPIFFLGIAERERW